MLKKLLKYDLKWIYKVLIVFYILSILFALFTRVLFSVEDSFILNIVAKISSGITISMIFNILINNIMRLWARFAKNIYGDESYLTHTLPVKKQTIYKAKFLAALITMFTSMIVIAATLFIAYYSKENLQVIKDILVPIVEMYDSTIVGFLLVIIFVFFLEMFVVLQAGCTGMILGHKKNNNKMGFSILFGFISYIITQAAILLTLFIIGLFNQDIMNMFITTEIVSIDLIKNIMYMAIIMYSVCIMIYYYVNIKLFKKGVNVD